MPVPQPVPTPAAAPSTGLDDSFWVSELRTLMEDFPLWTGGTKTTDGTSGVVTASSGPYRLTETPVYDRSDLTSVVVSIGATAYTVIATGTPSGTQVLVNYDTGELTFATAPAASQTMNVRYQKVRWRDATMVQKLYAGLKAMFPKVGKTYLDTTIPIQVNTWDYELPPWASDPRAKVFKVEVVDPFILTEPFREHRVWKRVGQTLLHIPDAQKYSPAAQLRISGWGPYLRLGDLEPQLYMLPVLYGAGLLLTGAEGKRLRADTAIPLQQEGARPPLANMQGASYYFRLFEQELDRLKRVPGPGNTIKIISTYEKEHYVGS